MSRRLGLIALSCLWLAGCQIIHLERNAPGAADLSRPPKPIEREALLLPEDPGEGYVVLSAGPFAGAGWRKPEGRGNAYSQLDLGVEASLEYGQRRQSHSVDEFLLPRYWPERAVALNIGWNLAEYSQSGHGPGYLELQYRWFLFGLAAGMTWVPVRNTHGPHFTLFAGPFMLRVAYLTKVGTDVTLGLVFKLPLAFVWSR